MTSFVARIAELLREHQLREFGVYCGCGHEVVGFGHSSHVAEVLVASLPELKEKVMTDEVIYPPHGYCIGFFFGSGGGMIGPFATEAEAREALAQARICVVGAGYKPDWDRP